MCKCIAFFLLADEIPFTDNCFEEIRVRALRSSDSDGHVKDIQTRMMQGKNALFAVWVLGMDYGLRHLFGRDGLCIINLSISDVSDMRTATKQLTCIAWYRVQCLLLITLWWIDSRPHHHLARFSSVSQFGSGMSCLWKGVEAGKRTLEQRARNRLRCKG